jgi:hypothetical protein
MDKQRMVAIFVFFWAIFLVVQSVTNRQFEGRYLATSLIGAAIATVTAVFFEREREKK